MYNEDDIIFENHTFNENDFDRLTKLCARLYINDFSDTLILDKYTKVSEESLQKMRPINDDEDMCPICFDSFTNKKLTTCKTCGNHVHEDCMIKWISMSKNTCVYCRGNITIEKDPYVKL